MADQDFASFINTNLLKPGATIEASKHMNHNGIHRILGSFSIIDPYVQAVLLQSVINIPLHEFELIQNEYSQLIDLASNSEDEWVRRKASEFRNYPHLTVDEDISEFDFSGVFDENPTSSATFQRTPSAQRNPVHFQLLMPMRTPSDQLPPLQRPTAPRAQPLPVERLQPKAVAIQKPISEKEREKERERERERKKKK
jgi:hypothetical protein